MKKSNFLRLVSMALLMLGVTTALTAQEVRSFSFNHEGKTGVQLKNQTRGNVAIEYNIDELSLTSFTYEGEEMQSIGIADISLPNEKGLPNVPSYSRIIAIPQGSQAVLHVVNYEQQVIDNVNVEPSLGVQVENEEPDMNYTKDMKVYSENAFYPAEFAYVSEPSNIRGVDVVNLNINPVRFNPVTKQAIVYHNIEVEVEFVGGNGQFGDNRLRSRYYDPILAQNILNYNSLPVIDYEARMQEWLRNRDYGWEYLIIIPNNDGFEEPANRLKEYRMQQGILTEVFRLDEIPATTTAMMKTWFHNAYNTWDIPPVAVLLFADHNTNMGQGIPAEEIYHSSSYGNCITDNQYADVTGDKLPEMIFSRLIAANPTEAAMMADKQIEYEFTNPNMNAAAYNVPITALGWQTERWFQLCSEVVGGYFRAHGKNPQRVNCIYQGTPGSTWSSNSNTSQVVGYFGPSGTNYIPQTPSELGGWTGGTPEQIVTAINQGTMLVQHRDHGLETGWGEPAFRNSHVAQLTNVGKMPFVFSINCLTGQFDLASGPCFAEAFMRHTYNGQNAGAVGLICPTDVSYSFVNDALVWGIYDHFQPDFMPTYGPYAVNEGNWLPAFGLAAGKYFLAASSWPYNSDSKIITYQMFTAHCDAFLRLYTEVPQTITANHQSVQLAGLNTFQITAPEGTMIALTKGEGENLEIVAVAEATGSVQNLEIEPQVPPTMLHLTITGQNYLRYETDIEVIPASGPYIIIDSYTLLDGAPQINFGDETGFNIHLKNVGNSQAPAGSMTISTESEYVTITNGTATFSAINSNSLHNLNNAFSFTVADNVPDRTNIDFLVTITSGSDTYESHITMKAYAPDFEIHEVSIRELQNGNGNGRLDPGETVRLRIPVKNNGNADSHVTYATITMNNPFLELLTDPTVSLESVAANGYGYFDFEVLVGNAPSGYGALYTVDVVSGVYTDTKDFMTKIGLNVEDFEGGVIPANWTNSNSQSPWSISSVGAYEGTYCMRSGNIGNNAETALNLSYEVGSNDSIAFYYKVSSEAGYDKLLFYIDNQEKSNWSGNAGWARAAYAVTEGTHTFTWKYKKDSSQTGGSDCAWIDFVILPVDRTLSVSAGADINLCIDEAAQLNGFAANQTSLAWTTAGDGTFDDATSLTALYTPGTQDIANGGTTLTLTAHKGTETMSDELELSFVEAPVASGTESMTVMTLAPIQLSVEIENYGIFHGWATTGTGSFDDNMAFQTVYTPSEDDYGLHDIVLSAEYTGCGYRTYKFEVNVHFAQDNILDVNEAMLNIHPNPTNDVLNVTIDNISSNIDIVIYNNVGQMVYFMSDTSDNGYNATIDLGELSSGAYILQVRSDENVWTKKIIKR